MAIAKVILNGETQMDVTQKTVTAGSMLSGTTALKNDGTDITGNIASKTSSDLTASGATVTAPAGYYASAASKSVASGSARTPNTTITANPTVSVSSSGLITATVSKTQNVAPTVSAGYVASGTAGTITVSGSGTNQLTTQAAQTIHPSTTDQTIASGKYLTGAQTVKAVTTTNLTAENIVSGVTVKVGDSTDDDCVASVTGTASGGRYVATISGTGNSSTCFVIHNGTYYYTNGDTFTYAIGDTLTCWVSYGDTNRLYVDDIVVAGGSGQSVTNYLYTLPVGGVGIELSNSRGLSYIKITTNEPTISITSNGTYDVYEYSKAEVNVPSGGGGGPTLLSSQTVELSCANTSWTLLETLNVGTNVFFDGIVYVKIRDTAGRRAGYFYGSDSYIYNMHYISNFTTLTVAAVSNNIGWYCGTSATNLVASRDITTVTEQGYYGLRAIQANTDGELTIWGRYSSSYSKTIDGTYKVDVYLLPYPGGTFE